MNSYVDWEVKYNEEEFWRKDIRPRRAWNLKRIVIARVARLQPIEIPRGMIKKLLRRAA